VENQKNVADNNNNASLNNLNAFLNHNVVVAFHNNSHVAFHLNKVLVHQTLTFHRLHHHNQCAVAFNNNLNQDFARYCNSLCALFF
jgi:hypothetical protein